MAVPASTAHGHPLVVLFVDNDSDTRAMYRCYLDRFGFVVEEASDGREAIAKTNALLPDVVVAEIVLPILDGFTLCRQIKQDPRTTRLPVIALTGYSRPDGPEKARLAGFEVFLLKPSLPEQLLAEICRVTRPGARIDDAPTYQ